VVTVIHGRLRTTYLPVRPSVRAGQVVAAGARIGVVEDVLGHCGQSSCLHWGLREGAAYLDPLTLLGRGPVRLLPWWSDAVRREGPSHGAAGGVEAPGDPLDGRPPSTALRTGRATRAAGAPEPARPEAGAASRPGRAERSPLPHGPAFAAVPADDDRPAIPLALVIDLLTSPFLRPGHSRRTEPSPSYPQNAIHLLRRAIFRQVWRRR
jgi:hypothetical protein